MERKTAWILGGGDDDRGRHVGLRAEIQAPEACAARQTLPAQVRPLSCRTAARCSMAWRDPRRFAGLIDRIGELNGIVYIKDAFYVDPRTGRVLSGALSHEVTMAGAHRVSI